MITYRHNQMSELHKQNLEKWRLCSGSLEDANFDVQLTSSKVYLLKYTFPLKYTFFPLHTTNCLSGSYVTWQDDDPPSHE